jgi:hypothetical protein
MGREYYIKITLFFILDEPQLTNAKACGKENNIEISSTSPRIKKLSAEKQAQSSHLVSFNFCIVTLSVFKKKIIAKSD